MIAEKITDQEIKTGSCMCMWCDAPSRIASTLANFMANLKLKLELQTAGILALIKMAKFAYVKYQRYVKSDKSTKKG